MRRRTHLSSGSLDSDPAIRWQVIRDLAGTAPDAIAAERSRVATEGWGAQLHSAPQSPAGKWGGAPAEWRRLPKEDRGLLITLYTLVVLKDLGLDPASKQARRMTERVDKRVVFKRHQEPTVPSRRNGAMSSTANSRHRLELQRTERHAGRRSERTARRWRLELRRATKPAILVPYDYLCARRTPRIRTSRAQIGGRLQCPQEGRELFARARHVPLAANRRSHQQTLAPLLVSDVLVLRRAARTRLSVECRIETRRPRQ